jgi:predicted DNA-binding protein YlxM (UPF0122 family)
MSNYWGGHVLLDPSDLERMFSEEEGWGSLPTVWDEPTDETFDALEEVQPFLDKIPAREADFIELYYFKKLRQTAIAELFNVSQPTVCYRLKKGAARLRYLVSLPEYDLDQMREDFSFHLSDPVDVEVLIGMVETTCQSEVARKLKATQGFVRYRFLRTLEKLREIPEMETYTKVLDLVMSNLNILKDTCRAEWDEEVIYSVV